MPNSYRPTRHPDRNPGNSEAAAAMTRLNLVYRILRNYRAEYDAGEHPNSMPLEQKPYNDAYG